MDWQPIESAPKDFRVQMIFIPDLETTFFARWDEERQDWLLQLPITGCGPYLGNYGLLASHSAPVPEKPANFKRDFKQVYMSLPDVSKND